MPILEDLANRMSSVLCCYRPPPDEPKSSKLRRLQAPSIVSVASVSPPHMQHGKVNDVFTTDADALRDIFSSSSSIRGYQAAGTSGPTRAEMSRSFDENFRLPQSSPKKKPSGRLEQLGQLGHHIKQRISESRLSQSSSKVTLKNHDITKQPLTPTPVRKQDDQAFLPGTSQQTTGLSALLSSRAGSDGGYDSDARSVQLPSLRSKTGTLRIGSSYAKQVLEKVDWGPEITPGPLSLQSADNSPKKLLSERRISKSTPHPETPTARTFTDALQMGSNESPRDALRRLSIGIADGSIKMPNTPELKAMRMPSIDQVEREWKLSLTAPRRASSLPKADEETRTIMKKLSQQIEKLRRDSLDGYADGKRQSLVSNIDPALLDYISSCGELDSQTADGQRRSQEKETGGALQTTEGDETPEDLPSGAESLAQSERNSIYLQNMRISQRLASHSHMQMLSQSNSYIDSGDDQGPTHDNTHGIGSLSSMTRFPSWIAHEHNRRPSDPETKRLFENDVGEDSLHLSWKSTNSRPSFGDRSQGTAKQHHRSNRDDASSFYFSNGSLPGSGAASLANTTRRNSVKNPNSIAMPGRIASSTFTKDYGSMGSLSNTGESAWLGKDPIAPPQEAQSNRLIDPIMGALPGLRNRSVSMPKESRFNELIGTPTPRGKRSYSSTQANELMSEEALGRTGNQHNLALIEFTSDKDRRNEHLSEVYPGVLRRLQRSNSNSSQRRLSAGWLSQGRRSGWGFEIVKETSRSQSPSCGHNVEAATQYATSNVWERALNRAREEGTVSGESNILSLPKFDRTGKRLSKSSTSECDHSQVRTGSMRSEITRSDYSHGLKSIEQHQRICSEGRAPLSAANLESTLEQTRECQTLKDRPAKKNLLEIRRFTSVGVSMGKEGSTATPPPKDFLSWTKFSSHTRAERCGTAGVKDGVDGTDFQRDDDELDKKNDLEDLGPLSSSPFGKPNLRSPTSWRVAAFGKRAAKSKSMIFKEKKGPMSRSPGFKKGLFRNWKRLYHSHSADLRRYAAGYRSSISAGRDVEYPELGSLPGAGLFRLAVPENESEDDMLVASPIKSRKRSASWSGVPTTSIWDSVNSYDSLEHTRSKTLESYSKRQFISSIETGSEAEECYPANEARRWSPRRPNTYDANSAADRKFAADVNRETERERRKMSEAVKTAPARQKNKLNSNRSVKELEKAYHRIMSSEIRDSTRDFQQSLMEQKRKSMERLREKIARFGEEEMAEKIGLPLPTPKIGECGLGARLGKKGSCEDFVAAGVDGAVV